jgi:hypothetical protein
MNFDLLKFDRFIISPYKQVHLNFPYSGYNEPRLKQTHFGGWSHDIR